MSLSNIPCALKFRNDGSVAVVSAFNHTPESRLISGMFLLMDAGGGCCAKHKPVNDIDMIATTNDTILNLFNSLIIWLDKVNQHITLNNICILLLTTDCLRYNDI